jgi:serine/threonine-protein kinase RsbW
MTSSYKIFIKFFIKHPMVNIRNYLIYNYQIIIELNGAVLMFDVIETTNMITIRFSSKMIHIKKALQMCCDYINKYKVVCSFKSKVIIQELLINAVVHGNRKDSDKSVTCMVEYLEASRFKITVEDEGEGFDHSNITTVAPANPLEDGICGYILINGYAEKIEFNDRGNSVTVYQNTDEKTNFKVSRKDGFQIIKPSTDLTAKNAEQFRKILVKLVDGGHSSFRFDLAGVENMDCTSLMTIICFANMVKQKQKENTLEIVNARPTLVTLFQLTRMDKVFVLRT